MKVLKILGDFKKNNFYSCKKTINKYKIISIEMKRYWKIFIVYLCTMDREKEGPPSWVGGYTNYYQLHFK